jgi:hypothetical protein
MAIAKSKYMKINEKSFNSKELLKQHNDETEEPLNLELGLLEIKNYLLKMKIGFVFQEKN